MKRMKFLSLVAAMLLSAGNVCAQADKTFSFVDANGNEVADGSTVTVYAKVIPGIPGLIEDEVKADFNLSVKNNTNAPATVALRVSAPIAPKSGHVQICFPGACDTHDKGMFDTESDGMQANEVRALNSEWFFDAGKYSEETTSLTILSGKAVGPTVIFKCIYADPAGIADMESDMNAKVVSRYDVNGNKLSAPAKGLNIIKLSNGKTVKTIIK